MIVVVFAQTLLPSFLHLTIPNCTYCRKCAVDFSHIKREKLLQRWRGNWPTFVADCCCRIVLCLLPSLEKVLTILLVIDVWWFVLAGSFDLHLPTSTLPTSTLPTFTLPTSTLPTFLYPPLLYPPLLYPPLLYPPLLYPPLLYPPLLYPPLLYPPLLYPPLLRALLFSRFFEADFTGPWNRKWWFHGHFTG